VTPEIAARLTGLRIEWFASEKGYTFFTRENCAAIAHLKADGFGLGSTGVMTEAGFAYLLWRDGQAYFAAHGSAETPASADQVEAVRQFSADLKAALAE
jgi:hypothetical protein